MPVFMIERRYADELDVTPDIAEGINRINAILGTMLALIVALPSVSTAAPDRLERAAPPPPMINGQSPRHREAAPLPPPPAPSRSPV